ncbi:hypothetical protein C8F01DRAFT_1267745 [Mycena amicta]|nr:hypothetical protein C8F01DRAFT_1267745 [Mycena amicta]
MADSTSPALPPLAPFTDSIIAARKREYLARVAEALSLPTTDSKGKALTKEVLVRGIHQRLSDGAAQYQTNPVFSALYATKEAKKAKTSADKTKEDLAQPDQSLTGANLKLHKAKVALDAPPGHAPLKSTKSLSHKSSSPLSSPPAGNLIIQEDGNSDQSDESSEDGSGLSGRQDEHENVQSDEEVVVNPPATPKKFSVLINLSHPGNPLQVSQQVLVQDILVKKVDGPDGPNSKFQGELSEILPALVDRHSPVKDINGRLSRPAIGAMMGPLDVGSVGAVIERNAKYQDALSLSRVNNITLDDVGEGMLSCSLFYTPAMPPLPSDAGSNPFYIGNGNPTALPAPSALSGPTSLTGAGTDIPMDIANNRRNAAAAAAAASAPRRQLPTPEFCELLRQIGGIVNSLPERANKLAADAIQNYIVFEEYFSKLQPYKAKKGYAFKPDFVAPPSVTMPMSEWSQFTNTTFTKESIIAASGWKPTTAKDIAGIFDKVFSKGLDNGHEVKKWANEFLASDPTTRPDSVIGDMQWGESRPWSTKSGRIPPFRRRPSVQSNLQLRVLRR